MNHFIRQLVPILLLCFWPYLPGAHGADVQADPDVTHVSEPLDKIREAKWIDVTLNVHLSGAGKTDASEEVKAKETKYIFPGTQDFTGFTPVTVFVMTNGQVWVGPRQDFYIQTESDIVGGRFTSGNILWCHSLVNKALDEKLSLDGAIKRLRDDVHIVDLVKSSQYSNCPKDMLKRVTELHDIFYIKNVFNMQPDVGCEKLCGVQVQVNTVRLDFKNIDGDTGSAWIDIKTQKLLKVVDHHPDRPKFDIRMGKDGIEVIPIEESFPQPEDYWLGSSAVACIVALLMLRWYRRRRLARSISKMAAVFLFAGLSWLSTTNAPGADCPMMQSPPPPPLA